MFPADQPHSTAPHLLFVDDDQDICDIAADSFRLEGWRVVTALSFQSRVGPVEWVRPYTDETIQTLGPKTRGHLVIVPISFTSDHIETLFEMDRTYRELALASGFASYHRVAPANDDPELAASLFEILVQHGF